jgi:RimJ/RimL family protein N-acetyltransferase
MSSHTELITERLLLRPIQLDDADAIFLYRSDSMSNQFQSWVPRTVNDVHDFINNRIAPAIDIVGTWYQFAIITKENNAIIGDAGIHFLDSEKKLVELGCTLDHHHHGKGYATEALNVLIRYLFNSLQKHRIIVSIDPRNKKSIELAERLGFRKEAHFKQSVLIRGEWADDLMYAILKDEWSKNRHLIL